MSSSALNQVCGICNGSLAGQGMFTAECCHSFHLPCFHSHHTRFCPVCNATWNNQMNILNHPFYNSNNTPLFNNPFYNSNNTPLFNSPFYNSYYNTPLFNNPFYNSNNTPLFNNRYPNPSPPVVDDDDSLQFFDDEPLVAVDPTPTSRVNSKKVAVKAIPERPAVAASESESLFTVLVGLKAPPLSVDAQRAPIDIVTVLDVSGSMTGLKLDLLKRAVHFVIDNLGVSDRLSIVAFSNKAKRLLPLQRMTENGREDAHKAVDKLVTMGGTDIVKGLAKGAKVLDERRHRNPVSTIIFLSDGQDTYNNNRFNDGFLYSRNPPAYLNLLPASIYPKNGGESGTIPVHSFGFGSDHDPVTMHAISNASGGTFSFIGSIQMIQDAFAGCIGGLLSVVSQEVRLNLRSASHGVEIKSISSGRYSAEILNQGSEAIVKIGDLYADEDKHFLISLSIPKNEGERNTATLLDISCWYKDAVSKETVQVEGDLVEIGRPEMVSAQDMVVNLEVDGQRNRVSVAESIKKAQQMAERGDLEGAQIVLTKKRLEVLSSASGQAGDSLCLWLGEELEKTGMLMGSSRIYEESGRAFALSGMSSHAFQRATFGAPAGMAAPAFGSGAVCGGYGNVTPNMAFGSAASFGGYATPNMAFMVNKSQQLNNKQDTTPKGFWP